VKLQGKDQLLKKMYENVAAFTAKMELIKTQKIVTIVVHLKTFTRSSEAVS